MFKNIIFTFDKNLRIMTALEESIYKEIQHKLKTAPKEILQQVLGYVDGILERKTDNNFDDLKMLVNEDYAVYKSGKSNLISIDEAEKDIDNFISENEN